MKFQAIASIALALAAANPCMAADWHVTYYPRQLLLVDKDSFVVEASGVHKFWTLYAPIVHMGLPGEGYAYSKMFHTINCSERTASLQESIYYDPNETAHVAEVEDKSAHNIVPDSQDDFLWQYVCKPGASSKLGVDNGESDIRKFLAGQAKATRENETLLKVQHQ